MTGRRIVVLTGAGISAPSGLPTYRGAGSDPTLTHPTALTDLQDRPDVVWSYFDDLRRAVTASRPNPAHLALAALSARHDVTVVTQNVDDLHERAGSPVVHHLHGELFRTRCSAPACTLPVFEDRPRGPVPEGDVVPACPRCGSPLRPDVVLFGEPLPRTAKRATDGAVADADLLLVLGTTLTVSTAVNVTRWARDCRVPRIWLTREPDPDLGVLFDRVVDGDVVEDLPALLAELDGVPQRR